jgi:anti-sigma factor RsiW
MTHPEDLLADYVDGTLPEQERALVDAHLEGCAQCREETELARGAVTALASLPEEPVPLGVTGPVLAEAGRRFERRRTASWRRLQWVAGAAAAAALVAVFALNGIGDPEPARDAAIVGGESAEAGGEEAPAAATAESFAPTLEDQANVNYDADGVRSVAEDAAASERTATDGGSTGATGADEGGMAAELAAGPDAALACLGEAGAPLNEPNSSLTRLIEARFQRTPAYLAVFLQGPGAGQPADHAVVWVVARNDCRILTIQSLPI